MTRVVMMDDGVEDVLVIDFEICDLFLFVSQFIYLNWLL